MANVNAAKADRQWSVLSVDFQNNLTRSFYSIKRTVYLWQIVLVKLRLLVMGSDLEQNSLVSISIPPQFCFMCVKCVHVDSGRHYSPAKFWNHSTFL